MSPNHSLQPQPPAHLAVATTGPAPASLAPPEVVTRRLRLDVFAMAAPARVGLALGLVALMWLAVAWALRP